MNTETAPGLEPLARLSALDDPVRQRLYAYVGDQPEPVSRDDAAAAVGIGRTLAAYHLDKLTDVGLLVSRYQRPAGRGGPGAGRPAKLYTRSPDELTLSVPPRDYELLARLLVSAVEHDNTGAARRAAARAAGAAGRTAGQRARTVLDALRSCGYEPSQRPDGGTELRNCPFHRLAQDHRDAVCALNLHLVRGLVAGAGGRASQARLDPHPDRCCVTIRDAAPPS